MRRLVLLLGVLVLAFGATALVSASNPDCTFHPAKPKDNPGLCRFCPPPEPDCRLVACDRCGCRYWCADAYPTATGRARPEPAPR